MKEERKTLNCQVCKKEIIRTSNNQRYCLDCGKEIKMERDRKTRNSNYWKQKELRKISFPKLRCPNCGKGEMQLDFDPLFSFIELDKAWANFRCSICGWIQTFSGKKDINQKLSNISQKAESGL